MQARALLTLEPVALPAPRPSIRPPLEMPDREPGDRENLLDSLRWRVRTWARALPELRSELEAARRAFMVEPTLTHALTLDASWHDLAAVLTLLEEAPRYLRELRRLVVADHAIPTS